MYQDCILHCSLTLIINKSRCTYILLFCLHFHMPSILGWGWGAWGIRDANHFVGKIPPSSYAIGLLYHKDHQDYFKRWSYEIGCQKVKWDSTRQMDFFRQQYDENPLFCGQITLVCAWIKLWYKKSLSPNIFNLS